MITLAFFIGGLILMPALSALNLWLIYMLRTAGFIFDVLLWIGVAVALTYVFRKIQRCKGIRAVRLLMWYSLPSLFIALLLLLKTGGSSLWSGDGWEFLMALSMLITDLLIMGMTAFGLWDDTKGDKTRASDDNSDV